MRRTYRRKVYYEELNKKIILIGILFIVFVIVGTCINKISPGYEESINGVVSSIEKYYSSKDSISVKNVILSNLKLDFKFMSLICILNLLVITFPVSILILMLKGVSIGYTINSCILLLKLKSIKIVFVVFIKTLAIIPGSIILTLVSINYLKEFFYEFKNRNRKNMIFLLNRYLLNSIIIITISLLLQIILNFVFINILQFLVR